MNWSAFWGGFAGNVCDIATLVFIYKIFKNQRQFKDEGKKGEWLK